MKAWTGIDHFLTNAAVFVSARGRVNPLPGRYLAAARIGGTWITLSLPGAARSL